MPLRGAVARQALPSCCECLPEVPHHEDGAAKDAQRLEQPLRADLIGHKRSVADGGRCSGRYEALTDMARLPIHTQAFGQARCGTYQVRLQLLAVGKLRFEPCLHVLCRRARRPLQLLGGHGEAFHTLLCKFSCLIEMDGKSAGAQRCWELWQRWTLASDAKCCWMAKIRWQGERCWQRQL